MSTLPFRGLPEETLIRILEYTCESVMNDATSIHFPSSRCFTNTLNEFRELHLVCHAFHRIVTHCIKTHGLPIRQKLLDLQMEKLATLFEACCLLTAFEDDWGGTAISIEQITQVCGAVWNNPAFVDFLPQLFAGDGDCSVAEETQWWFFYILPFVLENGLVEAEELPYATKLRNVSSAYNLNYVNHTVYRVSCPGFGPYFDAFEFVRGKYVLPREFHFGEDTWCATSILSFKDRTIHLNGPEGSYWLWYKFGRRFGDRDKEISGYTIIDTRSRKAFDVSIDEGQWYELPEVTLSLEHES